MNKHAVLAGIDICRKKIYYTYSIGSIKDTLYLSPYPANTRITVSATNKRVERKRYCSISNHFKTSQPHCLHVSETPQRMYAYA